MRHIPQAIHAANKGPCSLVPTIYAGGEPNTKPHKQYLASTMLKNHATNSMVFLWLAMACDGNARSVGASRPTS